MTYTTHYQDMEAAGLDIEEQIYVLKFGWSVFNLRCLVTQLELTRALWKIGLVRSDEVYRSLDELLEFCRCDLIDEITEEFKQ